MPLPPLDLDGLPRWLVAHGMLGLPVGEQVGGFCRRVVEAGFPMRRAQVGMYTLHPRYGSHTFLWRPGAGDAAGTITHVPHERALLESDVYLKSPVHHMRSRGLTPLRMRSWPSIICMVFRPRRSALDPLP